MADVEEFDDQEQPAPPISDTNLDDAGELDYEPSEPSANSIKDAVSDDEVRFLNRFFNFYDFIQ